VTVYWQVLAVKTKGRVAKYLLKVGALVRRTGSSAHECDIPPSPARRKNRPVTNDRKPWEPQNTTISDLVSLQDFREKGRLAAKAARAKYGKRNPIPVLSRSTWARNYDSVHVRKLIAHCQKDFSKIEVMVLVYLDACSAQRTPLSITQVQQGLSLASKRHASEAVARLVKANLIVNVGSARVPHLVIQPILEYWRISELRALRELSRPTRKPWKGERRE